MTDKSTRLHLPFLVPGQAQKEFFHNEALARIDMVLCAAVEGEALATPPGAPQPGQSWIVAPGATGAWAGRENALASWTEAGWRFVAPCDGMTVWDKGQRFFRRWDAGAWSGGSIRATEIIIEGKQVIGKRQGHIASPSGGSTVDVEARQAITSICATLRSHGLIE